MPITLTLAEYCRFAEKQARDFGQISQKALSVWDKLREDFPGWPCPEDARLAFWAHMVNHCTTTTFLLVAAVDCLSNPEWLKNRRVSGEPSDLRILVEETDKVIKKNSFIYGWTLTENALRRIISAFKGIDATGPVFNLCDAFFRNDLKLPNAAEIMNLVRLVTKTRNTIHNDFSYYPDRGGNVSLIYKGNVFQFEVGKQISFFTWDFVKRSLLDILEMYECTVRCGLVSSLPLIRSH